VCLFVACFVVVVVVVVVVVAVVVCMFILLLVCFLPFFISRFLYLFFISFEVIVRLRIVLRTNLQAPYGAPCESMSTYIYIYIYIGVNFVLCRPPPPLRHGVAETPRVREFGPGAPRRSFVHPPSIGGKEHALLHRVAGGVAPWCRFGEPARAPHIYIYVCVLHRQRLHRVKFIPSDKFVSAVRN